MAATMVTHRPEKMETVMVIRGMKCEHCERRVKRAVAALQGVDSVDVDLTAGTVTIVHALRQPTTDALRAAIEEQGYDVAKA